MTFKPVQKDKTPLVKPIFYLFHLRLMWWIQIASQWFVVSSSRWIRHSEDSQCLLLLHFLFQVNAAHALGNMLWLSYWPQAAFGVYLFIYLFEYWSEMSHPWACWMASLTWWTWAWVGSGSWLWTGKPGVLKSMGLQRVGHDWATELNWLCWFQPYINMNQP